MAVAAASTFDIQGEDLNKLTEIANEIEQVIRNTPGAVDPNNSAQLRDPEVRAILDRERLADLRLNATQVSDAMRTMVGGTVVTQLRPDVGNQVDIRLIANDATRASPAVLGTMPLVVDNTTTVRLDQVARIVKDAGPARIQRTDRQRVVEVSAGVSGRSLGDVARDVRAVTDAMPLPEGYRLTFAGQVQQLETAFLTLISALGLSVVLIYMLMVALYESWLTPFAIMFSLPVALVGAFTGLYLTGNTFNIFSLIGMIMLMGLAGKNAILLIDFCSTLRREGMERTEAILESAYIRLRPILMTTCTMIFAMLPLAMKLEEGGESRAPLAVVIIGGVITLVAADAGAGAVGLHDPGRRQGRRRVARRADAWPSPGAGSARGPGPSDLHVAAAGPRWRRGLIDSVGQADEGAPYAEPLSRSGAVDAALRPDRRPRCLPAGVLAAHLGPAPAIGHAAPAPGGVLAGVHEQPATGAASADLHPCKLRRLEQVDRRLNDRPEHPVRRDGRAIGFAPIPGPSERVPLPAQSGRSERVEVPALERVEVGGRRLVAVRKCRERPVDRLA